MKTGIDAISFDVAKLHLPIKTLAEARNIEPDTSKGKINNITFC